MHACVESEMKQVFISLLKNHNAPLNYESELNKGTGARFTLEKQNAGAAEVKLAANVME